MSHLGLKYCGKVMFLHLWVILYTVGEGLGLCLGGLCQGVSVQGGYCQGDPPRTVMCGQYVFYWNAFLFYFSFLIQNQSHSLFKIGEVKFFYKILVNSPWQVTSNCLCLEKFNLSLKGFSAWLSKLCGKNVVREFFLNNQCNSFSSITLCIVVISYHHSYEQNSTRGFP